MGRRLSKRTLVAFDARPELFCFVLDAAELARGVGPKAWNVRGCDLALDFLIDRDRSIYIARVLSGWPTTPARRSLCLAEVYAIATTGRVRMFKPPELKRWKLRLLLAAGLLEPPALTLPDLTADAPSAAVETWRAVASLWLLRTLDGDEGPLALSGPWLAEWAGLAPEHVRSGKAWLERHGYLTRVGTYPAHPKPGILWAVRTT